MHLRNLIQRAAFVALVAATFGAWLPAQQSPKVLTNADVIKMVKGGVPESVILSSIQSDANNFDLSPNALIRLHRLGVPKKVMDAMMAAGAKAAGSTASTPPADAPPAASVPSSPNAAPAPQGDAAAAVPSGGATAGSTATPNAAAAPTATFAAPAASAATGLPAVTFLQADAPQPIAIERTQLEETKVKPSSMLSLASDSALTPVVQGEVNVAAGQLASRVNSGFGQASLGQAGGLLSGVMSHRKPEQTYVWAVANPASSNVLPTTTPAFSVDFSQVPGVNPAEYRPEIVQLTPAQNTWRLVGATEGKADATSSSATDWQVYAHFLEDQVRLRVQKTAPGNFQISPSAPLLPGEYAVVLRPVSKTKKFSGADVARAQGDGLAFDSVWSFQVPPNAKAQ